MFSEKNVPAPKIYTKTEVLIKVFIFIPYPNWHFWFCPYKKRAKNSQLNQTFGAEFADFLNLQWIPEERTAMLTGAAVCSILNQALHVCGPQQAAEEAASLCAASINDVSCFSRSVANRCSGSVSMKRRTRRRWWGIFFGARWIWKLPECFTEAISPSPRKNPPRLNAHTRIAPQSLPVHIERTCWPLSLFIDSPRIDLPGSAVCRRDLT